MKKTILIIIFALLASFTCSAFSLYEDVLDTAYADLYQRWSEPHDYCKNISSFYSNTDLFPDDVINCDHVEYMELKHSTGKKISRILRDLKVKSTVKHMDIYYTHITNLNSILSLYDSLSFLSIVYGNLDKLSFLDSTTIEDLILGGSDIIETQVSFNYFLPKLKSLWLGSISVGNINFVEPNMPMLKTLKLYDVPVKNLTFSESNVIEYLSLAKLTLDDADFLHNLNLLETLNIDSVNINMGSISFCNNKNLRSFSLVRYNEESTLSILDSLSIIGHNIEKLSLSDCDISKLPEQILDFINLDTLEICRTMIGELPKDFAKLKKLRSLVFVGNNFKEFPEVLLKMENLEEIVFIKENIFMIVPETIRHKVQLGGH